MKNILKTTRRKYNEYFSFVISHLSSSKGFTLIELLIVFSITGILTGIGMASYSSYNNNQSLNNASADVLNMLTTAKSRSISQVKPPQCGNTSLTGYRVTFVSSQYVLHVLCGGTTHVLRTQDLPLGVTYATGSSTSITFDVLRGTSTPGLITLSGFGKNKNISVSSAGTISTN
jgi:prepilin-type N-terminal cleavage/methylation domain-containing protein